jgi:hypothetical protein
MTLFAGHGFWQAEYRFAPTDSVISIFIDDTVDALAAAPATVREFANRYNSLAPAFSVELRALFEPWHRDFWDKNEPLESGTALFERFELSALDLDESAFPVAEFRLKEGWDDAGFRIGLDNWEPKGLGVDD